LYFAAIPDSVSPDFTVYVVGVGSGAFVGDGDGPSEATAVPRGVGEADALPSPPPRRSGGMRKSATAAKARRPAQMATFGTPGMRRSDLIAG
jgi:hypothetical protein